MMPKLKSRMHAWVAGAVVALAAGAMFGTTASA